ncbi:MAG: DUF1565 domain-containing protein, partial [Bacteroidota bacterium]
MKNFTMQYSSTSRLLTGVLSTFLFFFVSLGIGLAKTPTGIYPESFLAGDTLYVSDLTGNDGNDGALGAPFKTIQAAIAAATSGDVIMVVAGTYTGPITVDKKLEIIGGGMGTIVQASGGTAFTYLATASG